MFREYTSKVHCCLAVCCSVLQCVAVCCSCVLRVHFKGTLLGVFRALLGACRALLGVFRALLGAVVLFWVYLGLLLPSCAMKLLHTLTRWWDATLLVSVWRQMLGRSVLRCVAVCCSVLQCVAVCCSVLQ